MASPFCSFEKGAHIPSLVTLFLQYYALLQTCIELGCIDLKVLLLILFAMAWLE